MNSCTFNGIVELLLENFIWKKESIENYKDFFSKENLNKKIGDDIKVVLEEGELRLNYGVKSKASQMTLLHLVGMRGYLYVVNRKEIELEECLRKNILLVIQSGREKTEKKVNLIKILLLNKKNNDLENVPWEKLSRKHVLKYKEELDEIDQAIGAEVRMWSALTGMTQDLAELVKTRKKIEKIRKAKTKVNELKAEEGISIKEIER